MSDVATVGGMERSGRASHLKLDGPANSRIDPGAEGRRPHKVAPFSGHRPNYAIFTKNLQKIMNAIFWLFLLLFLFFVVRLTLEWSAI